MLAARSRACAHAARQRPFACAQPRVFARHLSTALVVFQGAPLPSASFFFPKNGVLVGAALAASLAAASPGAPPLALPLAFERACAAAPTPLAPSPPPASAAGPNSAGPKSADFVFLVAERAARVTAFEDGAAAPTFEGDARAFARRVDAGFGQC